MTIQQTINKFLKVKPPLKVWDLKTGHVVKPAFVAGGIQYYTLADVINTYTERAMTALKVYEEWNMRCTKEHLTGFLTALENIINDPEQIKILEIANLINKLKERIDFILPSPELIWKMASVVYFDEHESPYMYDEQYNREKIEFWKSQKDMDVFFCLMELKELIPLPDLSPEDLKACLNVVDKISSSHLQTIIGHLLPKDQSRDFYNALKSELNTGVTSMN